MLPYRVCHEVGVGHLAQMLSPRFYLALNVQLSLFPLDPDYLSLIKDIGCPVGLGVVNRLLTVDLSLNSLHTEI